MRRLIGKNSRRWVIKRFARPTSVVQIPHAQERKFDNKRDGKFGALSMAVVAL
jgi:hypothetical protein